MYQAFLLKYAEIGIKGKNRYKFENALIRLFDTGRLEYDFHDLMEFMVYGLHQKGGEEKGLNSAFGTALKP